MANVFSPNGFVPVRRQDGAAWSGNLTSYAIAAADTNKAFSGDPVHRIASGYVTSGNVTTLGITGIFIGCSYLSTSQNRKLWSPQWPGSDATGDVEAFVIDDPNVVLRVWVGTGASPGTAGGPVSLATTAQIGNNINFKTGAGNALSGQSTTYVDFSTLAVTATLPFQIIGAVTAPPGLNGTDATTAGNIIEVIFNQMTFGHGAGVAGV